MLGTVNQRYTVSPQPVETLLTWAKSDEIAIPEIQRPFVWDSTKVRNLLDSLLRGYPIGYLIAWRNPSVRLKDGTSASGKRILIDGQQRVTALMAALLGEEVVTKEYEKVRIRVAFQPLEQILEVSNPAIRKDPAWIPDISELFKPSVSLFNFVNSYCKKNQSANHDLVFQHVENLRRITTNHVGLIELDPNLDIETVTEIFIRVNSAGAELSQADFVMSKIAANEAYGGGEIRKAIDYFCHMAVHPEFHGVVQKRDPEFAASGFFSTMSWLRKENDDIYDPSYTDILRVAFTSEFNRGRLQDLVALLSGRNFETKEYEAAIAEQSFSRLKDSLLSVMTETHFKRFVMIVRSAGFIDASLIGSQNALNFAYIIYLALRTQKWKAHEIERAVRRWLVMSMLTSRYSGSPETTFDYDIRQIEAQGFDKYAESTIKAELSDTFWKEMVPQQLNTSSSSGPFFRLFQAAQVKMQHRGFLSRDIGVADLILNKCDVHHIFPKNYLKSQGLSRGKYNQLANYALTQTEINIAIGDKPPRKYFSEVLAQCDGGKKRYGGITDLDELRDNLADHCIPEGMERMDVEDYDAFLESRRTLMAAKLKKYFEAL